MTHNEMTNSVLHEKSFQFSVSIIRFLKLLPNKAIFWSITDQLLRSGTSIGANIVEAKSSSSRKEFIRFYEIALRSCYETSYWLKLLKEIDKNFSESLDELLIENQQIGKMLTSSINTMKKSK